MWSDRIFKGALTKTMREAPIVVDPLTKGK